MIGEYTFVTLDNDMLTTGDTLFVDVDEQVNAEMDFVQIDDSYEFADMDDNSDFITMDDAGMINDSDIDFYSSDINESDVTIIL